MGGSKHKPSKREEDATLSFVVHDPKIDRLKFGKSELHLSSLREYLSGFRLIENKDGLNFENFKKNLRGIASYASSEGYLVVRTRSSIFIMSHDPRFADGASILRSADELLFIRRITSDELVRLMPKAAKADSFSMANPNCAVDLEHFKGMLRASELQKGSYFDLRGFADTIDYVGVFADEEERTHYVMAGQDSCAFAVYVNAEPSEGSTVMCRFSYKGDNCTLSREEIVT
jgi:hypothetical protein